MTYTVFFILILISISGLIAYLGDLLGRRMGKRRLSLFGLRPRYTAIIMTTITGMLIAALTLGAMLFFSSSLRQIVVRGERLVKDIKDYQEKNEDLKLKNLTLIKTSRRLSDEVQKKSLEVALAQKEVDKARRETAAALKARNEVKEKADALQHEISSKLQELNNLRTTGKLTKQRLIELSADLTERKKELSDVRAVLAKKDNELTDKLKDLADKDIELSRKQDELRQKINEIARAEDTINRQNETIQAQNRKLMEATQIRDMLLTGDVLLPFGQEVGRRVIDADQPLDKIKSELLDLIADTNANELRLHPGIGNNGKSVELVVIDYERKTILYPKDDSVVIDRASKAIYDQGRKDPDRGIIACLIVVSNTLRGELAPVEINLFINNLAFRRGEKIASKLIDGRMSEGRILLSVNDFLGENVRSAAARAGVLPVATPNPSNADEQIAGGQLDELMALVEKIRQRNMPVELHARAKKDIYAAGPLNMDNIQFSISEMAKASR